jgi:hypothetical protein
VVSASQRINCSSRLGWSDSWHQLKKPKPRHLVARVVDQAKGGEEILNVRRLQVSKAAIFHERDSAPREFYFEISTVVRRAKEYGLTLQQHAFFVELEHTIGHEF